MKTTDQIRALLRDAATPLTRMQILEQLTNANPQVVATALNDCRKRGEFAVQMEEGKPAYSLATDFIPPRRGKAPRASHAEFVKQTERGIGVALGAAARELARKPPADATPPPAPVVEHVAVCKWTVGAMQPGHGVPAELLTALQAHIEQRAHAIAREWLEDMLRKLPA